MSCVVLILALWLIVPTSYSDSPLSLLLLPQDLEWDDTCRNIGDPPIYSSYTSGDDSLIYTEVNFDITNDKYTEYKITFPETRVDIAPLMIGEVELVGKVYGLTGDTPTYYPTPYGSSYEPTPYWTYEPTSSTSPPSKKPTRKPTMVC